MISHQRRSQLKYPERHRARGMAQRALRAGKIRRRTCEAEGCEATEVQMHHPDYSEPLRVVFLCKPHHIAADKPRRCSPMAHVQHSFRLDADLSDRFVKIARRLHLKKVQAFRQAIADWNRDAAELADELDREAAGTPPESEE